MCNEVENLFERYNEAKKELEYHKNEAEYLEEEVEYLEREIYKMRDGFSKSAGEKMGEKDKRIEELERTVERHKAMAGYYYTTLANLVDNKRELTKRVDEQAELIKKLENEINRYKEFMEENEELKEENEELRRQVDGWEGLARENGVKSVEYCKRLEDKNKLIDYMCDKNDKLEKYVDKLNCDIAQKDEQIEKLNKELAIACVDSQTRMFRVYTVSRDEALKAINEAIKKLNEEETEK